MDTRLAARLPTLTVAASFPPTWPHVIFAIIIALLIPFLEILQAPAFLHVSWNQALRSCKAVVLSLLAF